MNNLSSIDDGGRILNVSVENSLRQKNSLKIHANTTLTSPMSENLPKVQVPHLKLQLNNLKKTVNKKSSRQDEKEKEHYLK